MAITYTNAVGDLPNAVAALYTAPGSTVSIVGAVSLVNKTGGAITCNLYVNRGGTRKRVTPQNLSIAAGNQWSSPLKWALRAADTFDGDASGAASIEYTLSIMEKS